MVKVTKCPNVGDAVKIVKGKRSGDVGIIKRCASVWGEERLKWSSFLLDINGEEVWVRTHHVEKLENAA